MPVSKNRRKKPKSTKKPRTARAPAVEASVVELVPAPVAAEPTPVVSAVVAAPSLAIVEAQEPLSEPVEPVEPPHLTVVPDEEPRAQEPSVEEPSVQEPSVQEPSVQEAAAALHDMASAPTSPQSDPFGRDPDFEQRALRMLEVVYRRYFRVEARGVDSVPSEGPAILVANHSGAVPSDGAMLKCALAFDHPTHRSLRPLSENAIFHFPFLGVMFNRFGAVRACQENAEALLDAGEAVAVFPEGVKGLGKLFGKRYQLQRFGRGGFVKLAMRTHAPIIPVAIVGAEEAHPLLARIVRPVEPLGLPYLPVTPTFPLFGPLGLLPLPTKWTIEFGEPITVNESHVADELAIERLTEDVRTDIQTRIDKLLTERKSWFR